jgi:hypothetical protein
MKCGGFGETKIMNIIIHMTSINNTISYMSNPKPTVKISFITN